MPLPKQLARKFGRCVSYESLENRLLLTVATGDCPPTITTQGSIVIAVGSDADDDVELIMGTAEHSLNFSGFEYTFDASQIDEIRLGGGFGTNSIRIVGSELEDTGSAIGLTGTLTSNSYTALSFSFQATTIDGGAGTNYAQIYGSNANDTLQGLPESTVLVTPTETLTAASFGRVDAYGRGGFDYAQVYGTDQMDHFGATDTYTRLTGPGMTKTTKGFERVDAFGRGGNDLAQLLDSPSDDSVVIFDDYSYLNNGTRRSYTRGFENVAFTSSGVGNDRATFYLVSPADTVTVAANTIDLARNGQPGSTEVENFDSVTTLDPDGAVIDDQLGEYATMLGALEPFLSTAALSEIAQRLNQTRNDVSGTDGGEELLGTNGNDEINALGGNDVVYALLGEDLVRGGAGNDAIDTAQGDDLAFGGFGNDELKGNDGDDILLGGAGNDIVDGEGGLDYVSGGLGNDLFRFISLDGTIVITDFSRTQDRIELINIDPADISTGTQWGSLTLNHPQGLNIVLLGLSPALTVDDLNVDFVTFATQTFFDPNA